MLILPISWDICIPSGCSFNSSTCDNNACINETLGQHISERTSLLNAIIKFQPSIVLLALVLILLFVLQKYLLEVIQLSTTKLYVKYKLFNSSRTKLFNYLLEAFSDGILHPRIYSPAN